MMNMRLPQQGAWPGVRLRWWIGLDGLLSFCRSIGRGGDQAQKFARPRDRFGPVAGGEQAVVADAVTAVVLSKSVHHLSI